MHSISKNDQQNILNLELAVFCLKQKASTKEVAIKDFESCNLHTGINILHVYYFCGKILISPFFFDALTIYHFPANLVVHIYHSVSAVP